MDSKKFVSVMTNFHNLASYNFSEIEEAKGEIKKKVNWCPYFNYQMSFHFACLPNTCIITFILIW